MGLKEMFLIFVNLLSTNFAKASVLFMEEVKICIFPLS